MDFDRICKRKKINKERKKFHSLTPQILGEEEVDKIYVEGLDFAFNDPEIKNIAITGIYGAGKSTVWKTYQYIKQKENNKEFENVIMVSLGKYDEEPNDDNNNSKRVEKQIINQMLSQIKYGKIPLSKYRFKNNVSICGILLRTILSVFFIASILLWTFRDYLIVNLPKVLENFDLRKFYWLCASLFLIPVIYFFFHFYQENRIKLSKVNIKGAEAHIKEEENETIFDRDIKEIVYLLKSSKSSIIVFEDLDRNDKVEIFTKLRELNFLLNSYEQANGKGRIIRFVYLLRDGLFLSKDRTKFFDFIIPVVPVVDSKTSENQLIKLLDHRVNQHVIMNISLYIDDMRLLKNIVNEYTVYSEILPLQQIELDKNKLFGLITLKNIFPKEFDLLQEDEGYIYSIFKKLENERMTLKQNIYERIDQLKDKIEEVQNRVEKNKYEAITLLLPSYVSVLNGGNKTLSEFIEDWSKHREDRYSIIYKENGYYQSYAYEEFLDKFIFSNEKKKKRIEEMDQEKETLINKINSEIDELLKEIKNIEIYSYQKLISKMNSEEIESLFSMDGEQEENSIVTDHYFPLIRYLIVNGLLDETYGYYKGKFEIDQSQTLRKNDTIFLKGLFEAKEMDKFLSLENPKLIADRLDPADFRRFNILNQSLLDCCIQDSSHHNDVNSIMISVEEYDNYDQLIDVLNSFDASIIERYVKIVLAEHLELLNKILEMCEITKSEAFKNILIAILIKKEISQSQIEMFRSFIEKNGFVVSYISNSRIDDFLKNVEKSSITFENLSDGNLEKERITELEKLKAYTLDPENLLYIAKIILDDKVTYGNLLGSVYGSELLKSSQEYIDKNYNSFISDYINSNKENIRYTNDEIHLVRILLSSISLEEKLNYIDKNDTLITDINQLNPILSEKKIFERLLDNDEIVFNEKNIKSYFEMANNLNMELINFVSRNINEENVDNILKENEKLCDAMINDSRVEEKLFNYVIDYTESSINHINSKLPKERISKLIQHDLIELTEENIGKLLELSYNDELVEFVQTLEEEEQEKAVELICRKDEINDDLFYSLLNSNISSSNSIKLCEKFSENILIERIDTNKKDTIKYVLDDELSNENIQYICNHFSDFNLKEYFIQNLKDYNDFYRLNNDELNDELLMWILRDETIDVSIKTDLIIVKINGKTESEQLKKYISAVEEIKEIASVWDNKYPIFETPYESNIVDALIKNNHVKYRKGNRIMLEND